MLFIRNKYRHHLLQKTILCFVLMRFFIIPASAQTNEFHLNPLLRSSFKKPVNATPLLTAYIKPSKHELMYWPNFPLTAAQIAERDRKYDRPIGQQIADDILESTFKTLIYGKKKVPATVPKF